MDLGNSAPCRSNRVCPDTRLFGIISMTYPVSKHLKEFDAREVRVPKSVVHLEVGAVRCPMLVECGGAGVGDVTPLDC